MKEKAKEKEKEEVEPVAHFTLCPLVVVVVSLFGYFADHNI